MRLPNGDIILDSKADWEQISKEYARSQKKPDPLKHYSLYREVPAVHAQIFQRQQRGRTHILTYVQLQLWTLKEVILKQEEPYNFQQIGRHSAMRGTFDTFSEIEPLSGNIFSLLHELHYLKSRDLSIRERDEVLRWIWTCTETLKSDLPTFLLCPVFPEHFDRLI